MSAQSVMQGGQFYLNCTVNYVYITLLIISILHCFFRLKKIFCAIILVHILNIILKCAHSANVQIGYYRNPSQDTSAYIFFKEISSTLYIYAAPDEKKPETTSPNSRWRL